MSAAGPQGNAAAPGSGPLPADRVVGSTPLLKEPRLRGGHLFWLEQLPEQRGRTTLRLRTAAGQELDLTPELDLRSRIHGYGGGTYCLAGGSPAGGTGADDRESGRYHVDACRAAGLTAVVVAEGGRSLWRLDLPHDQPGEAEPAVAAAPVRLTPAAGSEAGAQEPPLFGDGVIDLARQRWIGVCEQNGRDRLVAVPLSGGAPRVVWESPDFCGYAALSPSGSQLAWVSWMQPCMPWDRSLLWLGRFDEHGDLVDVRVIAGSAPDDERAISVFQPLWAGPDLVVANDRSGWWNLELLANAELLAADAAPSWRPLLPMQAEFAMPQWVYGMRTTAWDDERLVAACCRDGRWELGVFVGSGEAGGGADAARSSEPAGGSATTAGSLADDGMATAPRPGETAGATAADHPQGGARAAATAFAAPELRGALSACSTPPEGLTQRSGSRPEQPESEECSPGEPGNTAGSPASVAAEGTAESGAGDGTTPAEPVSGKPAKHDSLALHANANADAGPGSTRSATRASPLLRGPLRWQPIPLPFDDLAFLEAEAGRLVAMASGPVDGPGLLELTLEDQAGLAAGAEPTAQAPATAMQQRTGSRLEAGPAAWTHRLAAPALLSAEQISRPEPLWFHGHAGRPTHAWYYPPRGGASAASPLLLRGHSGPTAMARTGLSLAIQFWTSRGWGVVDVNYGGSTGFGRAYRERLDGGWGVVDVDDCLAAARAVVASGRADPARIAMEGSSASGFTVLAAMARDETIRAGAIRYPVTDLSALAEGDHRFEARYFDALVGPWPEARALYAQRSPLSQVARINAPLLFFHGLDDPVVPAQQSLDMVERLRTRGVPVELVLFEGEGHGFRDAAVQLQVLERSEAFFRERFGLT